MSDEAQFLTVCNILKEDEYQIPIYQRNYSWGATEIDKLLYDIKLAHDKNIIDGNVIYILGTLIVDKKDKYVVVDGQQRLTTLSLIMQELDNSLGSKLSFDGRPDSNKFFQGHMPEINIDSLKTLIEAKMIINTFLEQNYPVGDKDKDKRREDFKSFFKENTKLARVCLPKDTNLNSYFEIMNSRGEQLEQHEILKANLIGKIKENKDEYTKKWNACMEMGKYAKKLYEYENINDTRNSDKLLSEILNNLDSTSQDNGVNDTSVGKEDEFISLVSFSEFLLYALRAMQENKDISLDDKNLVKTFNLYIENEDNNFVTETFIDYLYELRCLFDKYVIKGKTKGNDIGWKLRSFTKANTTDQDSSETEHTFDVNSGEDIIMLQNMLRVATSRSNWLTDFLRKLLNTKDVIELTNFLRCRIRKLAKDILPDDNEDTLMKLNQGIKTPHYIFYYLDYLLWEENKKKNNENNNDFIFTYRNSIEHVFPQNIATNHKLANSDLMDNFGNLALVSSSENSYYNNNGFSEKKNRFEHTGKNNLKLRKIYKTPNVSQWQDDQIEEHCENMIRIIMKDLQQ